MAQLGLQAQSIINLYHTEIPGSKQTTDNEKKEIRNGVEIISNITRPTLTCFLPDTKKATGTAILICPGGGYAVNAFSHEGTEVAAKLNEMGVAAFVLKYRIPDDAAMVSKETAPLQDAQQAMKIIREHASEWNISPGKVGIMGFSAGGHLASTVGTHFKKPFIGNPDNLSLRPDFMVLVYPVISFQESITNPGSREQLIGRQPKLEKIDFFSNELHVLPNTPPSFMVHASDDEVVKPVNSIRFYEALIKNHVPAELHIYQKGGHGFGMHNTTTPDQWMDRLKNWMSANGWLSR